MLFLKNVSFAYNRQPELLKNISFELSQGEHLSLMGESGCGKSTLLKVIYGLVDVQEGSVLFHNERVWGPSRQLVPGFKTMKYLAQDFGLGPYHTVAENVGKFISNLDLDYKKERVMELLLSRYGALCSFKSPKPQWWRKTTCSIGNGISTRTPIVVAR